MLSMFNYYTGPNGTPFHPTFLKQKNKPKPTRTTKITA